MTSHVTQYTELNPCNRPWAATSLNHAAYVTRIFRIVFIRARQWTQSTPSYPASSDEQLEIWWTWIKLNVEDCLLDVKLSLGHAQSSHWKWRPDFSETMHYILSVISCVCLREDFGVFSMREISKVSPTKQSCNRFISMLIFIKHRS
jgi:hypothetical protein